MKSIVFAFFALVSLQSCAQNQAPAVQPVGFEAETIVFTTSIFQSIGRPQTEHDAVVEIGKDSVCIDGVYFSGTWAKPWHDEAGEVVGLTTSGGTEVEIHQDKAFIFWADGDIWIYKN